MDRDEELDVHVKCRPRRESHERWIERQPDVSQKADHVDEVLARVALVEDLQDPLVEGFDGAGDQQAAGAAQHRQVASVLEQVLDLNSHVIAEVRESPMQRLDYGDGMCRSVEEVRIPEDDVLGTCLNLPADVLEDHLPLHHPKAPAVDGHDRAVPAQVLAATRGLDVAADFVTAAGQLQAGVVGKRRQPCPIGYFEALARQGDQRQSLTSIAGPGPAQFAHLLGQGDERLLELPADDRVDAQAPKEALVHRRVQPVDAQVRPGVDGPHARDHLCGNAGGSVHGDVEGDDIGGDERRLLQRLHGQIHAGDVDAGFAEPGGRRGEPERLMSKLVGGDQDGAQRLRCCLPAGPAGDDRRPARLHGDFPTRRPPGRR